MRYRFTWATRREGNDGYVLEVCEELKHGHEFGPMPCHTVLAFVEGRRRIVAYMQANQGGDRVLEDLDYLKEGTTLQ